MRSEVQTVQSLQQKLVLELNLAQYKLAFVQKSEIVARLQEQSKIRSSVNETYIEKIKKWDADR